MVTIVISNNVPIGYTNDRRIDWWEIAKALHRNEGMQLDVDDYQQNTQDFIDAMIETYDLHVWRWSRSFNDFIEIT